MTDREEKVIDISRDKKKECCGCGACYNACPVSAITMQLDSEGAYYPVIDLEKCIRCGKCRTVCPTLHPEADNWKKPKCFAAFASDEIRKNSSSGGIFTVLAEKILDEGGVVCGAAFDEQYHLAHIVVESKEELQKLRSSKYVQSTTKKTYTEVRAALDAGRSALYTGCGCQIAGLRKFLGKDYEKLITIDLLCHGGPTPGSFQKYLEDVHGKKKISYVGFRDKDVFRWEVNSTGMTVKYEDGSEYRKIKAEDAFYRGFTRAFTVRPHCQQCYFATLPRQGDLTLGDFWGIYKYKQELNDGKGTSIVVANNEKAMQILEQIRPQLKLLEPVPLAFLMRRGQPFAKPFHPEPLRDRFMRMLKDVSYTKCLRCCEEDIFDYAYYAMKSDSIADILDAYAGYKLISRNNYSVLMVWDGETRQKEAFSHHTDEFADRNFPECVKVTKDCEPVQNRYRHIVFSRHDDIVRSMLPMRRGQKKVELSKVFSGVYSPLLFLPVECLDEIIDDGNRKKHEKYTVCYVKGSSRENVLKNLKGEPNLLDLTDDYSVEKWLELMKHAEGIVTNQREAVDMAIKYHVPVTILDDNQEVVSYAERLGMEKCIMNVKETKDMSCSNVDYENVYAIIEEQWKVSGAYLKKALRYRDKLTWRQIKEGIIRGVPEKHKSKIKNNALYKKLRGQA